MSSYIEFKNVTFGYQNEEGAVEKNVIESFDFSVEKGSFVAVLGHNGCGKSTIAKLCNGIEVPVSGKVYVDSLDTSDEEKLLDIRRRVGIVFQNPDNQIVATVVKEDVAFGLENMGVPHEEMLPRIESALSAVRMNAFADSAPHMLSGGQKQRVAIAGILAMEPSCIIADESTAMLDPSGRQEVLETIRRLNRQKGITVVWITHFMEEAVQADRVVVVNQGKIALSGAPRELFQQVDRLRELHLDVPAMTSLSDSLHKSGMPIHSGVLNVDDMVKEVCRLCPLQSSI